MHSNIVSDQILLSCGCICAIVTTVISDFVMHRALVSIQNSLTSQTVDVTVFAGDFLHIIGDTIAYHDIQAYFVRFDVVD